jgi:holo-[acyl-carrier protein] synthase
MTSQRDEAMAAAVAAGDLVNGADAQIAATAGLKAIGRACPRWAPVPGGVGTDIVAVDRIAALMLGSGTTFLKRWFTAREIDYCLSKAVPSRHFATRFAAKEAVVKALPVAWDGPLPWRYIEITNDPRGVPSVSLSGAILDAAVRAGVGEIKVSLSHCGEYAIAIALVAVTGDQAITAGPEVQT